MSPVERPRVEGDREEEILDATFELLTTVGYDRLTMDAVAREARASKATLYRRWESKALLVIDSLIRSKGMPEIQTEDTGSLRGDLMSAFCGHHGLANTKTTAVLGAVVTAVSTDPEFAVLFRERFIGPKAQVAEEIYQRAIERGEISPDIDLEIITPALAGVCLHRMYVMGQQPDDSIIERVIDHLILPAAKAEPATAKSTSRTSTTRKTS
jgi:AcrR family transcriptional regulator